MCSSQATRSAQNGQRWRVRRVIRFVGIWIGTGTGTVGVDGAGKGRLAGDVRVMGWPLWPFRRRYDAVRCGTVR